MCVQEDVCWSDAREDYPVPEENQDREPSGANRRGQCGGAAPAVVSVEFNINPYQGNIKITGEILLMSHLLSAMNRFFLATRFSFSFL